MYIIYSIWTRPGGAHPRPNRFQIEETSAQNGVENGRRTHCPNSGFGRPWGSSIFYLNGFSVVWSSIWSKSEYFLVGGRAAPLFLKEKAVCNRTRSDRSHQTVGPSDPAWWFQFSFNPMHFTKVTRAQYIYIESVYMSIFACSGVWSSADPCKVVQTEETLN